MTWKKQDIGAPISQDLANIAGAAGSVVGSLSSILTIATSLLQVAKVFVSTKADPFSALFQSTISRLEAFNNDIFGSGVFVLTINQLDVPGRRQQDEFGVPILFPREALQMAINSFDDLGDPNRPQFSDGAEVCAFGFLATAPSLVGLINLITALLNVFNIQDWNLANRRFKRAVQPPTVASVYPDWSSVRLNSVDQLKQIQSATNALLEQARGFSQAVDSISDIINAISLKASTAQQIINKLKQVLADLQAAAKASGIYVLDVPPAIGGNNYLKNQIFDCHLAIDPSPYTIVGIFVGGGPAMVPVNTVRQMLFI